jgi:acid phosphatase type 7
MKTGTLEQYNAYYEPTWGTFKAKTKPTPGNHDYHVSGAQGYFTYFGSQVPGPYYSFDLGSWHLISLNSQIDVAEGSAQNNWLESDLASTTEPCVLAYFHRPRFSGGLHRDITAMGAFWTDLYAVGADVVLNGHDHNYQRFAPMSPSGAQAADGIREFVVGTGGAKLYAVTQIANLEFFNDTTWGVIKLTLNSSSYDWQFISVGGAVMDSGSASCHN